MMMRNFSGTTPQQAPAPSALHSSNLAVQTALNKAHCRKGGSTFSSTAATSKVPTVVFQSPNRLLRIQATSPSVFTGAGRAAIGSKVVALMVRSLAFFDGRAGVVPIHRHRGEQ